MLQPPGDVPRPIAASRSPGLREDARIESGRRGGRPNGTHDAAPARFGLVRGPKAGARLGRVCWVGLESGTGHSVMSGGSKICACGFAPNHALVMAKS